MGLLGLTHVRIAMRLVILRYSFMVGAELDGEREAFGGGRSCATCE